MTTFDEGIEAVIEAAKADYAKTGHTHCEFGIIVKHGKKYTKLITTWNDKEASVFGFVVRADGPKFKEGDLLKAATFKAPATNHARGNIYTGFSGLRWTGPCYCGTKEQAENEARAKVQPSVEELTEM